ncbi:MAG: division/cell wall cluster transcriptional repressor MraZ [Candidatus Eisenbacteria bacterium RBG_16_71_46]|nr:MAG: division/cell wall cluster transcriptional repressor MraZ [Candidatus Eisenbacteria bacterium RBG_16_71_46]
MSSFYGGEIHAIDHKGRVSIPATLRRAEGKRTSIPRFFLAPGFDGCLALYSPEGWNKIEEQLQALPLGDREARAFQRAFLRHVCKVAVDAQGRITIPPSLLSLAGLGKEALLQGLMNRIEIWNPERFTGESDAVEGKLEDMAARVIGGRS